MPALAPWRATGIRDGDSAKPITAAANSAAQFVPGQAHLKKLGQLMAREIETAGVVANKFGTRKGRECLIAHPKAALPDQQSCAGPGHKRGRER